MPTNHMGRSLVAAVLLLAACSPDSAPTRTASLTEPARNPVKAVRLSSANGRSVVTTAAASDVPAALREPPLETRAFLGKLEAHLAKGPPALVLVDRALANGVIAEVHLNSSSAAPRFLVINRASLNDELIDRAYGALRDYEIEHPTETAFVKLSVGGDGFYTADVRGVVTRNQHFFEGFYTSAKKDRRSRWLLLSSERVAVTTIPGVGDGRLMSLGERRDK